MVWPPPMAIVILLLYGQPAARLNLIRPLVILTPVRPDTNKPIQILSLPMVHMQFGKEGTK